MNYKETYLYTYNQPKNKNDIVLSASFDITKYDRRAVLNQPNRFDLNNPNFKIVEKYTEPKMEFYGCDTYPEACFSPSNNISENSKILKSKEWEGIL